MRLVIIICCIMLNSALLQAQAIELSQYEGVWKGKMKIFKANELIDSVNVLHSILPLEEGKWTWKTEYLSSSQPIIKDYEIVKSDFLPNEFIIDEGDSLLLYLYAFENKIFSSFETGGFFINAINTFLDDTLIFEITSARLRDNNHAQVNNFQISNLQRVVLRREE